jgi:5-methyltetrahydrofolate--homocysteine methyltransferase
MICALHKQQVEALIGGSDLLVETIFDTLNAKAALCHRRSKRRTQYRYSNHGFRNDYDASGRTLSGQTVEAFFGSSHIPLLSVGFNCALADLLKPYLQTLSQNTSFNVSAHPNAGLPNAFGVRRNTSQMQSQIKEYLDDNLVNIIGGCCGQPQNISN